MAAIRPKARAPLAAAPQAAPDAPVPAAVLAALDPAHPALAAILSDIAASGSHTRPWGQLRSKLFPGPTGWSVLRQWCAEHSIACALNYGSSSRAAEVQFNRLRAGSAQ